MVWKPSYLRLGVQELRSRAESLAKLASPCRICPRSCEVRRGGGELGVCMTGLEPVVASWTPHFGEEPVISGRRGSGTVFLANCNLRCVFCQNHDISQEPARFRNSATTCEKLAGIFLELQKRGCHNINWVSPTHQLPQLVRALSIAAEMGLRIPVVYNTNAYDSVEALELLDGVVDIYMPDLKYSSRTAASSLSGVSDYPEKARLALKEMFRQVGDAWELDSEGVLQRGLLVRILVLPNGLAGEDESLRWIASELSPQVAISLMAQYFPAHKVLDTPGYELVARTISPGEWLRALEALERWMEGDHHYIQDYRWAPFYYRPDFSDPSSPFPDGKDFGL